MIGIKGEGSGIGSFKKEDLRLIITTTGHISTGEVRIRQSGRDGVCSRICVLSGREAIFFAQWIQEKKEKRSETKRRCQFLSRLSPRDWVSGPPLPSHLRASECVFVCEGLKVKSEVKARGRLRERRERRKVCPSILLFFSFYPLLCPSTM